MIVLAVAGLPWAGALLLTALRRMRMLSAMLAAATLLASGALALRQAGAPPVVLLGRPIALTPIAAGSLAFCALLTAAVTLHSATLPTPVTSHIIVLAAMGVLAAAVMIRNLTIASLLLVVGAVLTTMLVPSKGSDMAMLGARSLLVTLLLLPLLLVAVRSLETPGTVQRLAHGSLSPGLAALSLAVALGLAAFPFHVWQSLIHQHASGQAIVMTGVTLGIVFLNYLRNVLQVAGGGEMHQQLDMLLTSVGLASAVFGGLAALPQRSLGRILAYGALADLGIVLIGLGSNDEAGLAAARLHLAYRGIAVAAGAMALGTFRHHLGGDDDYHLRGAMQRAPLTVVGGALACLSLSGVPLTAGYATRVVLYPLLAAGQPTWALAVLLAAAGPVWASIRLVGMALAPSSVPVERREPLLSALLVLAMGACLVALGLAPGIVGLGPIDWLLPLTAASAG